jgi:hypothetical protein
MPTATSRRAPPAAKVLKRRRELAEERLKIERKLGPDYARIAELEAELKAMATEAGESFKEQFGADYVSTSGAVAAEFKGNVPVVQTEIWLALKPAERKDFERRGIVKAEPQYGRASNGRVTVKVHPGARS